MTGPRVVHETPDWVLVFKPHGMPSAPLADGESGTLLAWLLSLYPDAQCVTGAKPVEHGLIHRLDTATEGLVLVARTQHAFDRLWDAQQRGEIEKTYFAICSDATGAGLPGSDRYPIVIESRFRAYGPGRREVRPVFRGMRGWEEAGQDYRTVVTSAMRMETGCGLAVGIECRITRGFRHQIRSHLSNEGFPILGDTLYHPAWAGSVRSEILPDIPLQLHATGISFPSSSGQGKEAFSLPRPDKTTR